jgi:hypothetical protein
MKRVRVLTILSLIGGIGAACAALVGIFSNSGPGQFFHESIIGNSVPIYGQGIYRHMSSGVAIQGIAQDYVTAFLAVPVLLLTLPGLAKRSVRAQLIHSGVTGYLFVTYLFYLAMATYNELFLLYALLAGVGFFTLFFSMSELFSMDFDRHLSVRTPYLFTGTFLMVTSLMIALLWLSTILPPLLDHTLYPDTLEHYTTLIVQGFDLGLLLPACFVSGLFMRKKHPSAVINGAVFVIFLAFLMTALVAKITAMGMAGEEIIPAIIIIPAILAVDIYLMVRLIRSLPKELP